jgi:hypothetical protein
MIHLKSVASVSLHVRKVRLITSEQDDSQWAGKTPLTDELVDACGIGNCCDGYATGFEIEANGCSGNIRSSNDQPRR